MAWRVSPMRSKIMSAVRSKNTLPELALRKVLSLRGLKYRLFSSKLPGKPDIVFSKSKVAVFCDGDFWHGRRWKRRKASGQFKIRRKYWIEKIEGNIKRDKLVNRRLRKLGWLVLRFWESDILKSPEKIGYMVYEAISKRRYRR